MKTKNQIIDTELNLLNQLEEKGELNLDYIRENIDSFDDKTIRELICQLEKSVEQDRKNLASLKRQCKKLQLQIEKIK